MRPFQQSASSEAKNRWTTAPEFVCHRMYSGAMVEYLSASLSFQGRPSWIHRSYPKETPCPRQFSIDDRPFWDTSEAGFFIWRSELQWPCFQKNIPQTKPLNFQKEYRLFFLPFPFPKKQLYISFCFLYRPKFHQGNPRLLGCTPFFSQPTFTSWAHQEKQHRSCGSLRRHTPEGGRLLR